MFNVRVQFTGFEAAQSNRPPKLAGTFTHAREKVPSAKMITSALAVVLARVERNREMAEFELRIETRKALAE